MPSRQHHGKTRHGCKTCKKRKVRCDLGRPVCDNCTRLGRECTYAEQILGAPSASTSPAAQSAAPTLLHSPSSSLNVAWTPTLLDMELLHHFTAHASFASPDKPAHTPLWTTTVPKLSFSHSFLLHGILAVSALHKRSTTSVNEFQASHLLSVAQSHQHLALTGYIPLLNHITPANCHALFAFSQLLAAGSFALLQLSPGQQTASSFVAGVISAFDLIIGAAAVAIQGHEWLRAGPLSAMLDPDPPVAEGKVKASRNPARERLDLLVERIVTATSTSTSSPTRTQEQRQNLGLRIGHPSPHAAATPPSPFRPSSPTKEDILVNAVTKLYPLFPPISDQTKIGAVIGWPVFVDDPAYIALLKSENKAALAILAYYGVALDMLSNVWWLRGLGRRLVGAVVEILRDGGMEGNQQGEKEQWMGLVEWAVNNVGGRTAGEDVKMWEGHEN